MALFHILVLAFIALCASVSAAPRSPQRIIGGSATTIVSYPYTVSLLYSYNSIVFYQECGGTIINTRSILTAGHCLYEEVSTKWRARVGSSYVSSGGTIHTTERLTVHTSFNPGTLDNDVAILRTAVAITYITNTVKAAVIAAANYDLADNELVFAVGWGASSVSGLPSEQIRHVPVWTVNQTVCRTRYLELSPTFTVTDNMLCSGWLDIGVHNQCAGDYGGPLIHNDIIVGIGSWGTPKCGQARYPGVNTKVSRFTSWILNNS